MVKAGVSLEEVTDRLMKDDEFKEEYANLQLRSSIASQILLERKRQGITQEELARRTGTCKSNISRLESGDYNPSINFLNKIVRALGKELEMTIK